jgi:NAD(P)-dependent dehydrogenase (short-subunit alcohol dehydrogenase family)
LSEFQNKVVLVTGAGRGTGRAIAAGFAAQGAIVAANDLTPINLDETVEQITHNGGRARDYVFDVAKKMPVQAMIEQIRADWGGLDILINNAGVEPRATLLKMDEWDWRRTIDVNLTGAFFTMQSAGRVMREQGHGGAIVNIASSGVRAHNLKDHSAYLASKTGLIGLTREAARELADYHIRVNAVCQGQIATELGGEIPDFGKTYRQFLQDTPHGEPGKPADIVNMALFLCSQAAADISGQVFQVDGGMGMS